MASGTTFNSNLVGLTRIYIDDHDATERSPGTAYFVFDNAIHASNACIQESKSWELYCVTQVPKDTENGTCFGFAVRPEEKDKAQINDMMGLLQRINYWMGGSSKEQDEKIPVEPLDRARLKKRDFNVPQKDYSYLEKFGLRLALQDPYQENQQPKKTTEEVGVNKLLESFANFLPSSDEIKKEERQATQILVEDLQQLPASKQRDAILRKAQRGYYSDSGSPIATPKIQLINDLTDAGFNELAKNVMNGKYDEIPI